MTDTRTSLKAANIRFRKRSFSQYPNSKAEDAFYLDSIKFLSDIMVKYYNKNVIILIDEYDVPLENAFHQGFMTDMVT